MVIGVLVCGILAYAAFDVARTVLRRRRARRVEAMVAAAAAAQHAPPRVGGRTGKRRVDALDRSRPGMARKPPDQPAALKVSLPL
ncbi:hypothetical protein [Actinomadura sp. CNU-125]|uniref:hypothetical protein n=1 Tax=Actinomadura sp. CNU-125 TaxID=1904961 RepID=UPI0011787AA9|nr:hypothetical protein [Actinomadura sp. CNU-125]